MRHLELSPAGEPGHKRGICSGCGKSTRFGDHSECWKKLNPKRTPETVRLANGRAAAKKYREGHVSLKAWGADE
ncbi:MAG TPA: hypothetical protein PKV98_18915 [Burkholderiaceae bacterium]|nr:hypothetical protein [Burkholderiaceae bacterium]